MLFGRFHLGRSKRLFRFKTVLLVRSDIKSGLKTVPQLFFLRSSPIDGAVASSRRHFLFLFEILFK